jgi:hypothetical protein
VTDEEIVAAAIELAGEFYAMQGYSHRPGFKYWESPHPQEQLMWRMACHAFETLRGTDPEDALSNIE